MNLNEIKKIEIDFCNLPKTSKATCEYINYIDVKRDGREYKYTKCTDRDDICPLRETIEYKHSYHSTTPPRNP